MESPMCACCRELFAEIKNYKLHSTLIWMKSFPNHAAFRCSIPNCFMRKKIQNALLLLAAISLFNVSCQKEMNQEPQEANQPSQPLLKAQEAPAFDLNVMLYGEGNIQGHLKFRQDPDMAKIIALDITVHHLAPNQEYLLQRAVDAINAVDGNCTSSSWLTLGKGLVQQSIQTDGHGKGSEALWRDITAIPSGSTFDIHFRVIDAVTSAVVLTSDCHQYKVR
jgi:hypothetical protein